MAGRSVGIAWFAVGFLAGVGATLAIIIFATRPQSTRIELPSPASPAQPVVTYHPPQVAAGPAPPLAGPPRSQTAPTYAPEPAASPRRGPPDEQTQEDAAAAGMTSRARPSQ